MKCAKPDIRNLLTKVARSIPPLDAEVLLSNILGTPRERLLAHPEAPIPFFKRQKFLRAVKKRARGIPLAFLTGHKEFYGLDFLVNKHTLIPRQETELLVEETVKEITKLGNCETVTLIDIGTGTGCIPIAIKKKFSPKADQPMAEKHENMKTIAIDISHRALKIAKKNARKHGVGITFFHGNLLERIVNNFPVFQFPNFQLVITANLPYITQEQFAAEPSIQHEPRTALIARENGLALYKKLLKQISFLVSQFPSFPISLFIEIDPSQPAEITSSIKHQFPAATIEIRKDLAGNDRVVCVRM